MLRKCTLCQEGIASSFYVGSFNLFIVLRLQQDWVPSRPLLHQSPHGYFAALTPGLRRGLAEVKGTQSRTLLGRGRVEMSQTRKPHLCTGSRLLPPCGTLVLLLYPQDSSGTVPALPPGLTRVSGDVGYKVPGIRVCMQGRDSTGTTLLHCWILLLGQEPPCLPVGSLHHCSFCVPQTVHSPSCFKYLPFNPLMLLPSFLSKTLAYLGAPPAPI